LIRYIREHIWANLPERVTARQRLWAAALWGLVLLPGLGGLRWLRRRGEAEFWETADGFVIAGVALAAALGLPGVGQWVYLTILRAFSLIGWCIGNLGLTVIFYAIITPAGWLLRATGKSSVDLKFKRGGPPRWRRHPPPPDKRRYYRLF